MSESHLSQKGASADHVPMDSRYPIGRFAFDTGVTPQSRAAFIDQIRECPSRLKAAVDALPPGGLDRSYREGGWTARQVVHHVADSHLNAYMRFRLAMTEDSPVIRTYDQSRWAELADARTADPAVSIAILEGVHQRLVALLGSLAPADFARSAQHPEWGPISIDWLLQMYAWHGRHHEGHLGLIRAA